MKNLPYRFILLLVVSIFFSVEAFASGLQVPELYEYEMDGGRKPFINIINESQTSLKIATYKIDDKKILDAILKAQNRGVKVEVLMETETYKHDKTASSNDSALDQLRKAGISVYNRPHWVDQTHHKVIIADSAKTLLTTGNLDEESFDGDSFYPKGTRDFTVIITDQGITDEISSVFDGDRDGIRTDRKNPHLIWGPRGQRESLLQLVKDAQKSIWIYQQDIQDSEICETLVSKAKAGLDIRLVMIPFPFSKEEDRNFPNQKKLREAGSKVRYLENGIYIHAKVMLIDAGEETEKVYLGSCNFYRASINKNRELGIILKDNHNIEKIINIFKADFEAGLIKPTLK